MLNFKQVLICFILLYSLPSTFAQDLNCFHVGDQQNLSDEYITDVCVDTIGYVWMGTFNGLNRYDGISCKTYNYFENDSTTMGRVNATFIDSHNELWLGLKDQGILKYDPQQDDFIQVLFDTSNNESSQLRNNFCRIFEDSYGDIWGLSADGFVRKDHQSKTWNWYTHSSDSTVFENHYCITIHETLDSTVLIGFLEYNKVFSYDRKSDIFNTYEIPTSSIKSVSYIYQATNGIVWIGSIENGLIAYNPELKTSKHFRKHSSTDSLHSNEIKCIYEDHDSVLWIGTINGGLYTFSNSRTAFTNFNQDNSNLSSNSISAITQDSLGNYFFGSHSGLNIVNVKNNLFKHYHKEGHYNYISNNNVSSFHEDTEGNIWIGTDGGGLNCLNTITNEMDFSSQKVGLNNSIFWIEPNGDGSLWIASWGGGVSLYNPQNKSVRNYNHQNSTLNSSNVKGILKDGKYLWVATHGSGINIIDVSTNSIYNSSNTSEQFDFDMSLPVWGNHLLKDSDKNIWISTVDGLYRYDGEKLHGYFHDPSDRSTINSSDVYQTYEDSKQNIWICSNGLDLYDKKTESFIHINDSIDGLPSQVNSIIEDNYGHLWLSSNDGLFCLDLEKKKTLKYTVSNGLQGDRFTQRASLFTSKGILYFGGNNGCNAFSPSIIFEDRSVPPATFTSFQALSGSNDNEKQNFYWEEFIHNDYISLPYEKSQIISIAFNSVTIDAPEDISYSVRLIGFERRHRNIGSQRMVTYTSLEPGKYTLEVITQRGSEIAGQKTNTLSFTIETPWWQTWLFRILLTSFLGILSYLYVKSKIKRVKREKAILEKVVEERTLDLKNANQQLLRQSHILEEQNKNLNERKLVIELKNEELNEALSLKDKLIGVISHDFKNPLATLMAIIAMLKVKRVQENFDEFETQIKAAESTTQKLINQMVTVLDWAQDKLQNLTSTPVDINLESLIIDTIQLLQGAAHQKGIKISTQIENKYTAHVDPRMISTVFRNLLQNAVKFTPNGGNIIITCNEDDTMIEVSFIDTGIGISTEILAQLFTTYNPEIISYGTNAEKGTGLGLEICKAFVEKNNGTISAKSEEGKGTVMTVVLPKGETQKTKTIHLPEQNTFIYEDMDTSPDEEYTILLVDDNEELISILQNLFGQNYNVIKAFDGKSGVHLARNVVPNIIISDINMPNISGLELCRTLKQDMMTSHIPVILVSSEKRDDIEALCYQCGANDFLEKPFNPSILQQKVSLLVDMVKLQDKTSNSSVKSELELPESADDKIIKKIIELINENLGNPEFDMDLITKEIGLSRTQLWRKVKNILNMSPTELIRQYRIKKAEEMLMTGKYRISDIAYHVGYNDHRVFLRNFAIVNDMSPTEYIKKNQPE